MGDQSADVKSFYPRARQGRLVLRQAYCCRAEGGFQACTNMDFGSLRVHELSSGGVMRERRIFCVRSQAANCECDAVSGSEKSATTGIWAIGWLSWSATGRTGQRLERGKAASIVDLSPFNFCFGRHGRIGRLM